MISLNLLRRSLCVGGVCMALLSGWWSLNGTARGQAKDAKDGGDPWKTAQFLGAGACMKCHLSGPSGQDPDDFVLLTEYATWRTQDRHALAYTALEGPRGKQMAEILKTDVTKSEAGCLSCHAMNFPKERQGDNFSIHDGVSCDGCHGPAEKWLTPHAFQKKDWRLKTAADKEALGMRDLRNPTKRAEVCLSCHVGNAAEGKVVTHAMFAAGHPPLKSVEVASLSRCLPAHWRDKKDVPLFKNPPADTKAQIEKIYHLDTVGVQHSQLVLASSLAGLKAEMDLVAGRADLNAKDRSMRWPELALAADGGADLKQRWPELAMATSDCYGCHHELKRPSQRQRGGFEGRPGRPQVASWPQALVRRGVGLEGAPTDFFDAYVKLIDVLNERPFGDPEKLAPNAQGLAQWAGKQIEARPLVAQNFTADQLKQILLRLTAPGTRGYIDYDAARQIAAAVREIYPEINPKPAQDAEIAKILAEFGTQFDLMPSPARTQRLLLLKSRLEKASGAKLLTTPKAVEGVEQIADKGVNEVFPNKAEANDLRAYLDALRNSAGKDFTESMLKDQDYLQELTKINDKELAANLQLLNNYDAGKFLEKLAKLHSLLSAN